MNIRKVILFLFVCLCTSWSYAAVDVDLVAGKMPEVVSKDPPSYLPGMGAKAITDNNDDTYWASGYRVTEHTLTFDLGELCTVNSFRLLCLKYMDMPRGINILVSETDKENASFTSVVSKNSNISNDMQFYLDAPVHAKYIRIIFNSGEWDTFTVNDFKAMGSVGAGPVEPEKPFTPVEITGFNKDLIAEATPSKSYTNAGADDDKWVFYTTDVQAQGGFPSDGTIISSKGITYKLANYAGFNVLWNNSYKTSPVLDFVTPVKAKAISLLMTAANGDCSIEDGTVNYEDGTSDPLNITTIPDWGSNPSDYAVNGLGRIKREKKSPIDMTAPDEIDENKNFCLVEGRVETDPEKAIKSLTIRESTGSYLMIFAVSAINMSDDPVETNTLTIDEIADQTISVDAKKTIITNYSLGEAERAENFGISIKFETAGIVSTTDFYIDEAESSLEMELKGNKAGSTKVTLVLTNGNFTKETSFTVTVEKSSGVENEKAEGLNIYPNPVNASETLYVESEDATMVQVYSLEGMLVYQQTANGNQTKISMNRLSAGSYLVVVSGNNGKKTSKIVVK